VHVAEYFGKVSIGGASANALSATRPKARNIARIKDVLFKKWNKLNASLNSCHSGVNRSPEKIEPIDITGLRPSPE